MEVYKKNLQNYFLANVKWGRTQDERAKWVGLLKGKKKHE